MANLINTKFDFTPGVPERKVIRDRFNNIARNQSSYLVSDNLLVPVGIQTNNLNSGITIPSGAFIHSFSVIFVNGLGIQAGGDVAVGIGNASADVSFCASTTITNTGTAVVAGTAVSTSHDGKAVASGAKIGLADAAILLTAADVTPFLQVIVSGATLGGVAQVRLLCEFSPMGIYAS